MLTAGSRSRGQSWPLTISSRARPASSVTYDYSQDTFTDSVLGSHRLTAQGNYQQGLGRSGLTRARAEASALTAWITRQ